MESRRKRNFFLCGKFSTARLEVSPNLRHAGVFQTIRMANFGIGFQEPSTRVSMGGGFYGYQLKFCIFYGYRLILFSSG